MRPISRRDFLKLSALALGSLAFTPFFPEITAFEDANLVRVATKSVSVYRSPTDKSPIVATWYRDDLVNIYAEVTADEPKYNPVWYRVWGGYMHRARLQRVKVLYNKPLTAIPEKGLLAEVTVPYTQSFRNSKSNGWQPLYRLYYETVHWVVGIEEGPDGQAWYRLLDELLEINYHVPAIHMRPIPADELAPITPELPFEKKRIEVSLAAQTLTAYENDQNVFQTEISSGLAGLPSGNNIPTVTPKGRFNILTKMPSKHMGDGSLASDIEAYELLGVPWNCFFTDQGHAFHGTYWHDNFGVPMSHGCINMRMADAKWLFRWTRPVASYAEINPLTLDRKGYGTRVDIY
ncbi:MAG: L,D-transpeptidase family protein [Chloroflexi bacterium]|nr:L,D-transpeptidase family protein [Chloroflexota bacterium]